MKKILFFSLLLSAALACKQKTPQQQEQHAQQHDNHLYFLSIGNSSYLKDNRQYFGDEPGAAASANYVAQYLSCFGKGMTLTPPAGKQLTKEIMMRYIDSAINIAVNDTLSTTFIYYCGHGFSDSMGNVFMIPGDHQYNESASSLTSLISVTEIQNKIITEMGSMDYAKKAGQSDTMIRKLAVEMSREQGAADPVQAIMNFNRKVKDYMLATYKRPKFIIIADCCTEKAGEINNSLFYDGVMQNTWDELDKASTAHPVTGKMMQAALGTNGSYRLMLHHTKKFLWMTGSKTLYTYKLGGLAEMAANPLDKQKKIGPLCRRMLMYFNDKPADFSIAGLVSRLGDKHFDTIAKPAMLEDMSQALDIGALFSKKYKAPVTANVYVEKNEDAVFIRNCREYTAATPASP